MMKRVVFYILSLILIYPLLPYSFQSSALNTFYKTYLSQIGFRQNTLFSNLQDYTHIPIFISIEDHQKKELFKFHKENIDSANKFMELFLLLGRNNFLKDFQSFESLFKKDFKPPKILYKDHFSKFYFTPSNNVKKQYIDLILKSCEKKRILQTFINIKYKEIQTNQILEFKEPFLFIDCQSKTLKRSPWKS